MSAKRAQPRHVPPQPRALNSDPDILSREETRALLSCTRHTFDTLLRSGLLPHCGQGAATFFSRAEVAAWLTFWRQEATAETLITLCVAHYRQYDVCSPGLFFLRGLLRPAEETKLPRPTVWGHRVMDGLLDENTRGQQGSIWPSIGVGYIQVDTTRADPRLRHQRERITRWCRTRGIKLISVHEDVGISSSASLDQRPGLQAAMSALIPGSILVAVEWGRFASHVPTAVGLQAKVMQLGARILTVEEEIQRQAELLPQTIVLTLPGVFLERLDRYIAGSDSNPQAKKTLTRPQAIQALATQALHQWETKP